MAQVIWFLEGNPHGEDVWGTKVKLCWTTFLARAFLVFTVGWDEKVIRDYIRNLKKEDGRLGQTQIWN